MDIRNIGSVVKNIFSKQNRQYLISELCGGGLGYTVATATTIFLKDIDLSDELNAICTFTAKSIAFWIGNISTHRILHYFQHNEEPYPKHYSTTLIKSNVKGTVITGTLQLVAHYGLLKTGIVPHYLAPLVGYSIPGIFGSAYRHLKNFRAGLISVTSDKKSIDDML